MKIEHQPTPNIISQLRLSELASQATQLDRRRINWNLHPQLADPVQRFCNVMQPDTYVRPHRHDGENRWELFLALQGRAAVLFYDDSATIVARYELDPSGEVRGLEIPGGQWHNLVCLSPDTVLFEVKEGPYRPACDKDFAAWAPVEGEPECTRLVQWLETATVGQRWSV